MISEIETEKPKYLVAVHIITSWLFKPNSNMYIFEWMKNYIKNNNYVITGIIDLYSDCIIYIWDADALKYKPRSIYFIQVYERKY